MKSIVALIALVAVANAGVVLQDGYVGTWFDTMYVEGSTSDAAAPDVADITNDWYYDSYWDATNGVLNVSEYSNVLDIEFTVPILADENYGTCMLSYKLWNTAGDAVLNEIVCYCSMYWTEATCSFPRYIQPGVYAAELTLADWIGNWQVITSADDEDLWDVEVANLWVDAMAPTITDSEPTAAATVTIPAMNEDAGTAGAYVNFQIVAHDNEGADDFSSGIRSAGAWITDSEDVTMWFGFPSDGTSTVDDDGNWVYTYEIAAQFYNWADAGVWTVELAAVDYAGNWGMTDAAAFDITLTTLVTEAASGRPPQCDTFGIGDDSYTTYTSSDYNVIDAAANPFPSSQTSYVWFNMECNADYAGWNYAGALFASPAIQLEGWDMAEPLWVQTDEGTLPPTQMTWGDYDTPEDITWDYPGAVVSGAGDLSFWYDSWGVYNGYPNGEYTLDRVYTTTETGAVQVYDAALGSASSIVPSVLVVAVALVAAMLRL